MASGSHDHALARLAQAPLPAGPRFLSDQGAPWTRPAGLTAIEHPNFQRVGLLLGGDPSPEAGGSINSEKRRIREGMVSGARLRSGDWVRDRFDLGSNWDQNGFAFGVAKPIFGRCGAWIWALCAEYSARGGLRHHTRRLACFLLVAYLAEGQGYASVGDSWWFACREWLSCWGLL
jgi:hypothetical protein